MPFIPPIIREDRGEIEAALRDDLPDLVEVDDIKADLHVHSNWSDGRMSILEMAKAAKKRGLEYIVICDHSVSLGIANGLSVDRLAQQVEAIREVNEEMGPDFRVFQGTELEIRADGTLDYSDNILSQLDFVIASLHVSLRQPREQIMNRLLQAVENPHVDMIAHPTGRLIPDRLGADIDMETFLEAAARTDTIVEINANPQRLDLKDLYVRRAMDLGVKLAINSDAHHSDHFDFMHYGIAVAQRGWAPAAVIVNTWPVETFRAYLRNASRI
jgi:DNA polymerase (family 10)